MDTLLGDGAKTLLSIVRNAARKGQFPEPFDTVVIQTILESLDITSEEFQQVTEILKADIREASATY